MKLSKLTILEMLKHQVLDMESLIREMDLPYLGPELSKINQPVELLIAWLSDELVEELSHDRPNQAG